jgi:hypothetical protein
MKNTILTTFLMGLSALLCAYFFEIWWLYVIPIFMLGFLNSNEKFKAFRAGFLAVFIPWLIYILLINNRNDGILAARVAALFKHVPSFILILVCSLLGGILGAWSSFAGHLLRRIIWK